MSHTRRDHASHHTDEDALEAQADRLLWEGGRPRDLEYSFYHERTLGRAAQRDRLRREAPPPTNREVTAGPGALGELLEALLSEAALPARLARVLALARRGLTHRQIAEALGIETFTARRWHQQALARLRRYCGQQTRGEAVRNLQAAYREQVAHGAHPRESHCAPGREACRRDGLCKYRWYLHWEGGAEW